MLTNSYSVASIILLVSVLAVAVWFDLDRHRIPNLLTFGSALIGLLTQVESHGAGGALDAAGGLITGLVALLPFYIAGGMAAGDVKLMAGVGAFLQPSTCLFAVGLTLLVGGLMGVVALVLRGGFVEYFSRYLGMFKFFSATGQFAYAEPHTNSAAASRFPYALAIAIGTLAAVAWRLEW